MHTPRTLYIVTDGGRARYIERVGPAQFSTFRNFVSAHLHEKAVLVRDSLGRVRETATTARLSKIESAFIRSLAEDLSDNERTGGFDNMVVVAPARLQKILRDALAPGLTAKLARCINKNLTKVPDNDLYSHLPVFLVPRPAT